VIPLSRRQLLGGAMACALPGCAPARPTAGPLPADLFLRNEKNQSGHTLRIVCRTTAVPDHLSDAPAPHDVVDMLWFLRDASGLERVYSGSARVESIHYPFEWLELDAIPRSAFDAPISFAAPLSCIAWLHGDASGGRERLGYHVIGPLARTKGGRARTKGWGDSAAHGLTEVELLDVVSDIEGDRAYLFGTDEHGDRGVLEVFLGPLRPRKRFTALRGAKRATSAAIHGRRSAVRCIYAVETDEGSTRIVSATLAAGPWEGRAPSFARETEIAREPGRCLGVFASATGWVSWLQRDGASYRVSTAETCNERAPDHRWCLGYERTEVLTGPASSGADPISVTSTDGSLALLFETDSAWEVRTRDRAYTLLKADAPPGTPVLVAGLYTSQYHGVWLRFPDDATGFKTVRLQNPPEPGMGK